VRTSPTGQDRTDHLKGIKFPRASWSKRRPGFFYQPYPEPTDKALTTLKPVSASLITTAGARTRRRDVLVLLSRPTSPNGDERRGDRRRPLRGAARSGYALTGEPALLPGPEATRSARRSRATSCGCSTTSMPATRRGEMTGPVSLLPHDLDAPASASSTQRYPAPRAGRVGGEIIPQARDVARRAVQNHPRHFLWPTTCHDASSRCACSRSTAIFP